MKKAGDVVWGRNPDSGKRTEINVNFEAVPVLIPRTDSKLVSILFAYYTVYVSIRAGKSTFKPVLESFSNSLTC